MGVGLTESGEHKTMCRQEMERKTNMGLLKNVKKNKLKKNTGIGKMNRETTKQQTKPGRQNRKGRLLKK